MSRAKWKGPYASERLLNQNFKKSNLIIAARNSNILPKFIGQSFKVHNGNDYKEIKITKEMVGHKFGEFVTTRAVFSFKKKIKKK